MFIKQIEDASKLAEVEYSTKVEYKLVWISDHSSCHTAMAEGDLDVSTMNTKAEGKQLVMRDTAWAGKPQSTTFALGIPKVLCSVLEEQGVDSLHLLAHRLMCTFTDGVKCNNHVYYRNM